MCASKKSISAHQLHRTLEITYKSARLMAHRIREAMKDDGTSPIGGQNKLVEVDETYVGGKEKNKHSNKRLRVGRGCVGKQPVVSLVERGGRVRSMHLPEVTAKTLKPVLKRHIHTQSYLITDEAKVYPPIADDFAGHGSVNHGAGEYVRGSFWHTNTVENYFSLLKRGIIGTSSNIWRATSPSSISGITNARFRIAPARQRLLETSLAKDSPIEILTRKGEK